MMIRFVMFFGMLVSAVTLFCSEASALQCLHCPTGGHVCWPNNCTATGCRVSGPACDPFGGTGTSCPALPYCPQTVPGKTK
jgi:hypothetical protein